MPRAVNPPWQRDELILALDLYFRHHPSTIDQNHQAVRDLSDLLNTLPIHRDRPDATRFRNANAVHMKLRNFLHLDPDYQEIGLRSVGHLDRIVWDEFSGDLGNLHRLALALANANQQQVDGVVDTLGDELAFPEGRLLYRLHLTRERNQLAVRQAKMQALMHASLICQVCDFDFEKRYGKVGTGYIECHHTTPVSDYRGETTVRVQDLALVCSNCHRMLHRRRPLESPVNE